VQGTENKMFSGTVAGTGEQRWASVGKHGKGRPKTRYEGCVKLWKEGGGIVDWSTTKTEQKPPRKKNNAK